MAVSALFKTAYLQHTIIEDAVSTDALTVNVWDLVLVSKDAKGNTLVAAVTGDAKSVDLNAPPAGQQYAIVGQSDVSMAAINPAGPVTHAGAYAHVPVEEKDLRFDSRVQLNTTPKRMSLFQIINPADIVLVDYTAGDNGGRSEQLT